MGDQQNSAAAHPCSRVDGASRRVGRAIGREPMDCRTAAADEGMPGRASLRAVVQIVCKSVDVRSCDILNVLEGLHPLTAAGG